MAFALGMGLSGITQKKKIHLWKPFRAVMSSPSCPVAFSHLTGPMGTPSQTPKPGGTHATLLGPPARCQQYSCLECYLEHPTLGCTSACIYRAVRHAGKGLRAKKKNFSFPVVVNGVKPEKKSLTGQGGEGMRLMQTRHCRGAGGERSGKTNQKKGYFPAGSGHALGSCTACGSVTQGHVGIWLWPHVQPRSPGACAGAQRLFVQERAPCLGGCLFFY